MHAAVIAQGIHVFLHPRIGEGKDLTGIVAVRKIDIHIAVVEVQRLDVAGERRDVADRAVGNTDLQLLPIGKLLHGLPFKGHLHIQAAVFGVGLHLDTVVTDVVIYRCFGALCGKGQQQQAQSQTGKDGE